MKTVGIAGLGIMGSAMAANLSKHGFAVVGFDVEEGARSAHGRRGGTIASSLRALAEGAPILITSLPSSEALLDVARGVAATSGTGQIIIECSTLSLEVKTEAFDILAAAGKILLDCPVSGTGAQAARQDLVVFGSGDRAAFDRCVPVFEGMSRKHHYLGAFGNGSIMKYLANHLVTIHNVASAEVMVLGLKAGLDPALVYDTLCDSAATSRIFEVRGPLMRDGKYDAPTATIKTHTKDMSIIERFASGLGCPVPLFSLSCQVHYAGVGQGLALLDTASVCTVLENMAGVSRTSTESRPPPR